jgi:biotin operon repressor
VEWIAVDAAVGRKGDVMSGDVHRYGFPRSDLKVTLDGTALKAGFALGSYAAFVASGSGVVVMGDLVLTEPEVAPVMAKLQEQGVDVTAVHNHLLREQPKVMYLHYLGRSPDAVGLARSLHTALAASATPLTAPPPAPPTSAADLGFDPAAIDRLLGRTGTTGGGLQKYGIARAETVTMGPEGLHLTPALGVGTVVNFQPLGGGKAAITGDFALAGAEVALVAKTLREKGIEVTAVHSHMTDDNPHLYYLHFFATGPAADLAQGLRAALDVTNSTKS